MEDLMSIPTTIANVECTCCAHVEKLPVPAALVNNNTGVFSEYLCDSCLSLRITPKLKITLAYPRLVAVVI